MSPRTAVRCPSAKRQSDLSAASAEFCRDLDALADVARDTDGYEYILETTDRVVTTGLCFYTVLGPAVRTATKAVPASERSLVHNCRRVMDTVNGDIAALADAAYDLDGDAYIMETRDRIMSLRGYVHRNLVPVLDDVDRWSQ